MHSVVTWGVTGYDGGKLIKLAANDACACRQLRRWRCGRCPCTGREDRWILGATCSRRINSIRRRTEGGSTKIRTAVLKN